MQQKPNVPSTRRKGQTSNDAQRPRTASAHIRFSIQDLVAGFIAMVVNALDVERGEQKLIDIMTSAFLSRFGDAMTALKVNIAFLESENDHTQWGLSATRRDEADTDEWVPARYIEDDNGEKRRPDIKFEHWQTQDKIEVWVIAVLLPLAMAASAITAHSNLVGTGLPVFTESVLLPWTMSVLAPMSGLAIKSIWRKISSRRWKRMFSNVLNATAILSIGTWVWLFADQYHGLSPSNSVSGLFDEPTSFEESKQTAFVAVTLITEVLITSVLAHHLDVLWERYSPHFRYRNLDSEILQEREARLLKTATSHTENLADMKGQLAAYEADLDLQIKLAVIAYHERRARFAMSNS